MPVILTIGHRHFLLKNESQGAAVLKALSGAIPMERDYSSEIHMDVFKPADDQLDNRITIAVISRDQIQAPLKRIKDPKRLLENRSDPPLNFGR